MKKEDFINNYIKKQNNRVIENLQKQIDCNHIWKEHGLGFVCKKCSYYTGLNHKLNEKLNQIT